MNNLDLLYPHDHLTYTDIRKFNDNFLDGRIIFTDKEGYEHSFKGLGWHLWESAPKKDRE